MRNLRSSIAEIGLCGALAAGCSSSGPAAVSSTSRAPASTTTSVPAVTPKQAALALARGMVARAVLPAGARRSSAPLPALLSGPFQLPSGGNIVQAHSEWVVTGGPGAVVRFLQTHAPVGLVYSGTSGTSNPTASASGVIDRLRMLPANVANAGIQIGVADGPGGTTFVRVDGVVQFTAVRPADEQVPARDHAVIVSVFRAYENGHAVVRRVVVTDPARVARLTSAFARLHVAPKGTIGHCFMLTPKAVGFRVAFAASASTRPDIVATIRACSPIAVTVGGHTSTDLSDVNGAFGLAVAHVLGTPALQYN